VAVRENRACRFCFGNVGFGLGWIDMGPQREAAVLAGCLLGDKTEKWLQPDLPWYPGGGVPRLHSTRALPDQMKSFDREEF
jgi:hypothetical protein